MGTYVTEAKIEGLIQFDIDATTSPSTTEVATWITEIEADADARNLGSYTATDQTVDVPARLDWPAKNTIAWLYAITGKRFAEISNRVVIPPYLPIISITSLSRNTADYTAEPDWEALTEGPGSGDSYIILKRNTKTDQYLGFALYFYQNTPYTGYQKVKMTYSYGWNLSTDIIGEWCTLKVALKVLDAVMHGTTPIGAGDYGMLDIRVGIDPARRRVDLLARIEEIERLYFPGDSLGIAIVKNG